MSLALPTITRHFFCRMHTYIYKIGVENETVSGQESTTLSAGRKPHSTTLSNGRHLASLQSTAYSPQPTDHSIQTTAYRPIPHRPQPTNPYPATHTPQTTVYKPIPHRPQEQYPTDYSLQTIPHRPQALAPTEVASPSATTAGICLPCRRSVSVAGARRTGRRAAAYLPMAAGPRGPVPRSAEVTWDTERVGGHTGARRANLTAAGAELDSRNVPDICRSSDRFQATDIIHIC